MQLLGKEGASLTEEEVNAIVHETRRHCPLPSKAEDLRFETKLGEALGATANLSSFALKSIASDATTCAQVMSDPVERDAWILSTKAMNAASYGNDERWDEIAEELTNTIKVARGRKSFEPFKDSRRARMCVGAIEGGLLKGSSSEKRGDFLDLVSSVETDFDEEEDVGKLGSLIAKIATDEDYAQSKTKEDIPIISNYIASQFKQKQIKEEEDIVAHFEEARERLDEERDEIELCLEDKERARIGCFEEHKKAE